MPHAESCSSRELFLPYFIYTFTATGHFRRHFLRMEGGQETERRRPREVRDERHREFLGRATVLEPPADLTGTSTLNCRCAGGPREDAVRPSDAPPPGRRDKSAPVEDDELSAIEPGLSLVTDSGFVPITLTNAPPTTAVQRLVAERLEVGARTDVAGQHRRLWRGDLAGLWPNLEAAMTGSWLRTGPVAWTYVDAARRPIPTTVASLAWIPSPPPQDAESIRASLVATGRASGEVFDLHVLNRSGEPAHLVAPDGVVVEPIKVGATQPVAARSGATIDRHPVLGYCLDFAKPPPVSGMLFRLAPPQVQQQFQSLRAVLRAGRRLAGAGRLRPDSDPRAYVDAIKQWAVWTRLEKWDVQAFTEHFVARTKENARQVKQPWTRGMEEQLRASVPNRWRDITAVLDEARAIEGVAPLIR
ncbi:MAG: hypothetical protein HYS05_11790 [Acidobacteria bacterium]|nr:hypothetical protein [Acidobacteriota bacterium]